MANRLNMAKIQAIEQLQALKWSQRKIARELGIHENTARSVWNHAHRQDVVRAAQRGGLSSVGDTPTSRARRGK